MASPYNLYGAKANQQAWRTMFGQQAAETGASAGSAPGGVPMWMKLTFPVLAVTALGMTIAFTVIYSSNKKVIEDADYCQNSPCYGEAQCVDLIGDFLCVCPAGFTGKKCSTDINECDPNPCGANGQCTQGVNSFTCKCNAGYIGKLCQTKIDYCEVKQCLNEGTCQNNITGFTCNCPQYYSGVRCEIRENACSSRPCNNGASCFELSAPGSYSCVCLPGYTGTNCNTDINECATKTHPPCLNGGLCVDEVNGYSCNCTGTGSKGNFCETKNLRNLALLPGVTCSASGVADDRFQCDNAFDNVRSNGIYNEWAGAFESIPQNITINFPQTVVITSIKLWPRCHLGDQITLVDYILSSTTRLTARECNLSLSTNPDCSNLHHDPEFIFADADNTTTTYLTVNLHGDVCEEITNFHIGITEIEIWGYF